MCKNEYKQVDRKYRVVHLVDDLNPEESRCRSKRTIREGRVTIGYYLAGYLAVLNRLSDTGTVLTIRIPCKDCLATISPLEELNYTTL